MTMLIQKLATKARNRGIKAFHFIQYLYAKAFVPKPQVMDIHSTIDYIIANRSSVSRNGDGELNIMAGRSIPFQDYDKRLADIMHRAANYQAKDYLSCVPEIFSGLGKYNAAARKYFTNNLHTNLYKWLTYFRLKKYGSTFISRPYIDLVDKTESGAYFEHLKKIWEGRDVVIIEGEKSRLGVGNDLFAGAQSMRRILGPAVNGFSRYNEIIQYVVEHIDKKDLILLALGPTATAMSYDLYALGYWAIDIGHVDIEYEWMLMGATTKVPVKNKYTNEAIGGTIVGNSSNSLYENQIIAKII